RCGHVINPTWLLHFQLPLFAKNAKAGATDCAGDARKVKNLGHPPDSVISKDSQPAEQEQKAHEMEHAQTGTDHIHSDDDRFCRCERLFHVQAVSPVEDTEALRNVSRSERSGGTGN